MKKAKSKESRNPLTNLKISKGIVLKRIPSQSSSRYNFGSAIFGMNSQDQSSKITVNEINNSIEPS